MPNIAKINRFEENPFLSNKPVKSKNKVIITNLGDNTWVNQSTGEIAGTQLIKFKKVDGEKFIKIFTENLGLFFNLTSAGNKTFAVLMWVTQQSKNVDFVELSDYTRQDFIKIHPHINFSKTTFFRGLSELEKSNIIAKSVRQGKYFINPHFIFNGDRIAFTTIIERTKTPSLFDIPGEIGYNSDKGLQ